MPPGDQQHASIRQRGGLLKANLDLVQASVYSMPAAALEALANNPAIVYISPDRDVAPALDYANPTVGTPIALQYGWDGPGVGIAVIDSGITAGRDFLDKTNNASNVSRIVYNQSFVSGATSATDLYGHGTHVAAYPGGQWDRVHRS
jgi:subtilisin family serine protease